MGIVPSEGKIHAKYACHQWVNSHCNSCLAEYQFRLQMHIEHREGTYIAHTKERAWNQSPKQEHGGRESIA